MIAPLMSKEEDPSTPCAGQYWQSRGYDDGGGLDGSGGGKVKRIDHLFHDGEFVSLNADRTYYLLTKNLKRYWRRVDHVPVAALHVGGRLDAPLVSSWFEYVVALETVTSIGR